MYPVTLRVTDEAGKQIIFDPFPVSAGDRAPIANFTVSDKMVSDNEAVSLTGHVFDPDGDVAEWIWDFGNGSTSDDPNPTHAYDHAGTYVVMLTVMDECNGSSRVVLRTVVVENSLPVAAFSAEHLVLASGKNARFYDESYDVSSSGRIVHIAWDFSDASYAAGNPNDDGVYTHTYSEPGLYTVVLYVIDDEGGMSAVQISLIVEAGF